MRRRAVPALMGLRMPAFVLFVLVLVLSACGATKREPAQFLFHYYRKAS